MVQNGDCDGWMTGRFIEESVSSTFRYPFLFIKQSVFRLSLIMQALNTVFRSVRSVMGMESASVRVKITPSSLILTVIESLRGQSSSRGGTRLRSPVFFIPSCRLLGNVSDFLVDMPDEPYLILIRQCQNLSGSGRLGEGLRADCRLRISKVGSTAAHISAADSLGGPFSPAAT